MKNIFVAAIHSKNKVRVEFYSKDDSSVITRVCAPMDYGPSRKFKDGIDRYHLWDYDSDNGPHTLSLPDNQISKIEVMDDSFDPKEFVTWPENWIIPRNWA